ncbi:hypothetical protein B0A52_01436, partial [Exophiala mesophila]
MAALTSPNYTIRHATQSDIPTILAMINELATYEHALHEVQATESSLLSTLSFPDGNGGFTPGYAKTILLLPHTGPPAGMALYFHNYSTWRSAPGIYLEDLFRMYSFGMSEVGVERVEVERAEYSVLSG